MTVNMEKVLSKHNGPRDLGGLLGKQLYVAALVQEDTGSVSVSVSAAAGRCEKVTVVLHRRM